MIDDEVVSTRARALAAAIEPVTGQVYFSPECHEAYAEFGFAASPAEVGGVAMPDGPAYFCSRGSVLGQVPGEVVAAAFGVFNPAIVVPLVSFGWTLVTAEQICAARTARAIGLRPEGRPLYAGLLGLGLPGDPIGDMWRLADRLREFRGDAHIAAWTSAGFDATEIGLLTELYWGLPLRSYSRTRATPCASSSACPGSSRLTPANIERPATSSGTSGQASRAANASVSRPALVRSASGSACEA